MLALVELLIPNFVLSTFFILVIVIVGRICPYYLLPTLLIYATTLIFVGIIIRGVPFLVVPLILRFINIILRFISIVTGSQREDNRRW
jgi:hypothetical protein